MANYTAQELATAFRTVRGNTIQIAQDIPADKYDFVPAPGVSSVSMQFKHIAHTSLFYYDIHRDNRLTTLKGYDFAAIMGKARQAEAVHHDKDGIVALLKTEGEKFASWLEELNDSFLGESFTDPTGANPKSRLQNLMGAKEHEMHHRGQLMLIQRMIGVVPHLTRQREERARGQSTTTAAT